MYNSEYYRLKAEELYNQIQQAKSFITKHNLTIGMFAEDILRNYLREILPQKVRIAQGFIYGNGNLSGQCDIIIYDCLNYAPLFTFGDLIVVSADAVIAVVEVKTSIQKKTFVKTLKDFEVLSSMGVSNKFLFIYDACTIRTLEKYIFYPLDNLVEKEQMFFISSTSRYDYDSCQALPEGIIGLKQTIYLKKDHVDTGRDVIGYSSLVLKEQSNKEISCLQTFIEILSEEIVELYDFNRKDIAHEISSRDSIGEFSRYDGFALFDM